jgi:hypothetical protein
MAKKEANFDAKRKLFMSTIPISASADAVYGLPWSWVLRPDGRHLKKALPFSRIRFGIKYENKKKINFLLLCTWHRYTHLAKIDSFSYVITVPLLPL